MILENKYLPFRGFAAMAVWPVIFKRKDCVLTTETLRHEKIHFAQQRECFVWSLILFVILGAPWYLWPLAYVVFYLLYFFMWLWHLAINTRFERPKDAYNRICFEREAYEGQEYSMYLDVRKPFAWLKHILKKD